MRIDGTEATQNGNHCYWDFLLLSDCNLTYLIVSVLSIGMVGRCVKCVKIGVLNPQPLINYVLIWYRKLPLKTGLLHPRAATSGFVPVQCPSEPPQLAIPLSGRLFDRSFVCLIRVETQGPALNCRCVGAPVARRNHYTCLLYTSPSPRDS